MRWLDRCLTRRFLRWWGVSVLFLLLVAGQSAPDLTYRDRGDRYEGVKPKPVAGYDIELLGAMVNGSAVSGAAGTAGSTAGSTVGTDAADDPSMLGLSFFLPKAQPVSVVVREREPQTYYWLDQVRRDQPYWAGTNLFRWPATEVLRPLQLGTDDLLALVRLNGPAPGRRERVAPVALPGSRRSLQITTYRFVLRVNAPARLRHGIFAAGSSAEVVGMKERRKRSGGKPFDIVWNAEGQPAGSYRLVVEGYFLDDNMPVDQEVTFFHQPVWPAS